MGVEPDHHTSQTGPGCCRRRAAILAALVALTTAAALMTLAMVLDGGWLDWLLLALVVPLYSWLAIGFWTALAGWWVCRRGMTPRRTRSVPMSDAPESRTVLVMPVRDEAPAMLIDCLEQTCTDLIAHGAASQFEVFVLSDSTAGSALAAEARAVAALQRRFAGALAVHYRRRARNHGRKAGNIAAFIRRWGARYRYMVVLDADSVMHAETLCELVRRMDADPRLGLLQTVSLPAGQRTLFGRFQQFAAWLQARMLAAGQAAWLPGCSNYYGHNAILRVEAFAESAGLPTLPGPPPLGGEILSHDFVEAALLRRAGWRVALAPDLGGSFEQMPSNLHDYARRDRRWTEGNLQHLRLMTTPRLHLVSRLHFLVGALGFIASLLWLVWLLLMTLRGLPGRSTDPNAVMPMPVDQPMLLLGLLIATLVLLFGPRLLAVQHAWQHAADAVGGRARLLASSLMETLWSVVTAPVMMLYHACFVLAVVCRRSVPWAAQQRAARQPAWLDCLRHGLPMCALGVAWILLASRIDAVLLWWLILVWGPLLLAPLLLRWSGSRAAGDALAARGLLLTPNERSVTSNDTSNDNWPPTALDDDFLRPPPPPAPRPMPIQPLCRDARSKAHVTSGKAVSNGV